MKYTAVTQLHYKNNKEIIEYFEDTAAVFSKMERKLFYIFRSNLRTDINKLNKELQEKYSITKRTAASAISNMKGRVRSLTELKKYEIRQKELKIHSLDIQIGKLTDIVNEYRERLRDNEKLDLAKYNNLKKSLVFKKKKLNKFQDRLKSLKWRLDNNRLRLCFGTRKLLRQDMKAFKLQRDSQMVYAGSKDDKASNQMLQLKYDRNINQFIIKLRKDFKFKNAKGEERYAYGKCYFNFQKDRIRKGTENREYPLTYSIIRRNGRYYLHCTFEINNDISSFKTRKSYGTIGVDFNRGFVAVAEVNEYGSLIDTYSMKYRFGQGSKRDNDFKMIAGSLIKSALSKGKDIVIESLDFFNRKSGMLKGKNKRELEYNRMLNTLAYSKFGEVMESMCCKNEVTLNKADPAYTSRIAKEKYCQSMKLNIHNGAAYVIARRAMGLTD